MLRTSVLVFLLETAMVFLIVAERNQLSRGTSGQILQYYDDRVKQLRPLFVADSSLGRINVESRAKGGSVKQSSVVKSFSEFVETSNIAAEAKLDLMLSIFSGSAGGSMSTDAYQKTSTNSIYAIIELIQEKHIEKINICDDFFVGQLRLSELLNGSIQATDVIVGKIFGLHLNIKVEISNIEHKSIKDLEIQLRSELNGIMKAASFTGDGTSLSSKSNKTVFSSSKISTFCNLVTCPIPPESFDQVEDFIRDSYSKLDEGFEPEGNEIYYILEDLEDVRKCANFAQNVYTKHSIDQERISKISKIMKTTERSLRILYDLEVKLEEYKDCIPSSEVNNLANISFQAENFVSTFKSELRDTVIQVRFGTKNETAIDDKINSFNANSRSPTIASASVLNTFRYWVRKISFYDSLKKDKIHCLPQSSSLVTMLAKSRTVTVPLLLIDQNNFGDKRDFLNNLQLFITKCVECPLCECYVADCFFNFSFCDQINSTSIYQYSRGKLTVVTNGTRIQVPSPDEEDNLRNAILYLYLGNLRTLMVAKSLNEKIDYYKNHTVALLASRFNQSGLSFSYPDLSEDFEEDALGPGAKNRTIMNSVEKFYGDFIILDN